MTLSGKRASRLAALALLAALGAGSVWMLGGSRADRSASTNTPAEQAEANPRSTSKDARRTAAREVAPSANQKAEPSILFRAAWGGGAGDLGRHVASEGASEGPMSFGVNEDGDVYVLDQVNRRIQIFAKGKEPRSIPLDKDTYQDIEVRRDGSVVVLDRLTSASVTVLDPSGKVLAEAPLVGSGVEEGGSVTAMFSRDDGIWVEVNNTELVRVADASGHADPLRPRVAGRFALAGMIVRAAVSKEGAVITTEDSAPGAMGKPSGPSVLAVVRFPLPLVQITALETTPTGIIALAAFQLREGPNPQVDPPEEAHTLVVLDKDGREIGRAPLAPPTTLEQFRPIRLLADGSVYQLGLGEDGAAITRVNL